MKQLHGLTALFLVVVFAARRTCSAFSARAPERPPAREEFSFPQWSREGYIKIHQTVNRRKAFGRLLDISRVLAGRILRPLVCSLVNDPVLIGKDWDDFWLQKKGKFSNAERVALGLPSLGPTYVKLGQALATRPDILHVPLAEALCNLQDSISPFDNLTAKRIIHRDLNSALKRHGRSGERACTYLKDKKDIHKFLESLSEQPVAAASIAQVYKGYLPGFGPCAVKVQRPGITRKTERDATLFHSVAVWLEHLKWGPGTPFEGNPLFGRIKIVQTVDEFTSRVFEDMDFEREVQNMQVFGKLYDHRRLSPRRDVRVVVPRVIPELCTSRIIVMEWLEGTKLTDICVGNDCEDSQAEVEENLRLVRKAIECTISQLVDTGVLHADPHTGNLLKVTTRSGKVELGYLDFGLVNKVPQRFRDGIVCAVVQIVFARNLEAVADLCVDIGLLSEEKMNDPEERKKLRKALETAFNNILIWPVDKRGRATQLPKVRFQNLLACLAIIVAKFDFTIPPYFLNNARALATLEGIALKIDPNFNILRVVYPYSINHLMRNPKISLKAQETFLEICRNPDTKLVDLNRFKVLLNDWALLTGNRKRRVFWDLMTCRGGRHITARIAQEWFLKRSRQIRRLTTNTFANMKRLSRRFKKALVLPMAAE
jgi:aarF domain-containing kinase